MALTPTSHLTSLTIPMHSMDSTALHSVRRAAVILVTLAAAGCVSLGGVRTGELHVEDFTFNGPLGSEGAAIEKLGRNHFRVTLAHAPEHPDWPNKLNFQILRNARGNDLRLEVAFPGGPAYSFNEYHQSWSYDGVNWNPIAWKLGHIRSKQEDELYFPEFTADRVHVGTQTPLSFEQAEGIITEWARHPNVRVHSAGRSMGGRALYRVEVTDPASPHPRARRWVHYFANQHPGEHNSQWRLVGLVDWVLGSDSAAIDFRRRNIVHVILMMSPDAPSHGWYRVNQEGVDMNRSYRPEGADSVAQTHEPYLWQKDFEALMASDAPVTTAWAIHTWSGIVEPIVEPGPEIGGRLGDWTQWREAMLKNDPLGTVEPLRLHEGPPSYGGLSWSGGPHAQFGITGVLCEGGAVLQTRRLNMDSGAAIIRSVAEYYAGTK